MSKSAQRFERTSFHGVPAYRVIDPMTARLDMYVVRDDSRGGPWGGYWGTYATADYATRGEAAAALVRDVLAHT